MAVLPTALYKSHKEKNWVNNNVTLAVCQLYVSILEKLKHTLKSETDAGIIH